MYEPASRHAPNAAFLLPALFAASASEMAEHFAKQFTSLAIGSETEKPPPPEWTTPHRVALQLKTVQLRDFATSSKDPPCLLCTPFALHGSTLSDLATGHSLVAALGEAGVTNLFVTDWHSASHDMRFRGIDDYLADLNVLVDEIGAPVDLIGLCQGGWMALVYAARFPGKVRKLVLAAAPVDTKAAPSVLSTLADGTAMEVFREVVRLGDGLVLGNKVLKLWGPGTVEAEEIRQLLESEEAPGSSAFTRLEAAFREWYAWTVDLPGPYFLETVEKLYKRNEIADGTFVALGKPIDLRNIETPLFLLAAGRDELVTPPQLFAVERLVGTPPDELRKLTADCRHLGLFMGKRVLCEVWPGIVEWLIKPGAIARHEPAGEIQPAARIAQCRLNREVPAGL
ncbi:MAG TPA: alpha/beta fold hydrolase [Pseudolabrys sp.]|nr:alpha/beta fold hydrolase [Pseudolabrys sp.]